MDTFDEAVITYFTRHIPDIRVNLEAAQFDTAAWNRLLSPEAMAWMFARNNEVLVDGDVVAHKTSAAKVKAAVASVRTRVKDPAICGYLQGCHNVYDAAHGFVADVIEKHRRR